ncbi:MAG TPA: hypothetical protein VF671_25625 [Pseudomonas sp.]|jgi:hypothetical protein|uniref:hypothetical protein n=1 Tax=Pseudomonas sp. TaxID=306 RepID=UPI002ED87D31
MLLNDYEAKSLLCNLSVLGATSTPETFAYRGDLVLEEGDVADSAGRRHPPKAVVKQAILLSRADKLAMVAGALMELSDLPMFSGHYQADLAADALLVFYVENLGKALKVNLDGVIITLLPHDGGAVWNTLMDDLKLDKDDFKGRSTEDKVTVMYQALAGFSPRLDAVSYEAALAHVVTHQREARGAI